MRSGIREEYPVNFAAIPVTPLTSHPSPRQDRQCVIFPAQSAGLFETVQLQYQYALSGSFFVYFVFFLVISTHFYNNPDIVICS